MSNTAGTNRATMQHDAARISFLSFIRESWAMHLMRRILLDRRHLSPCFISFFFCSLSSLSLLLHLTFSSHPYYSYFTCTILLSARSYSSIPYINSLSIFLLYISPYPKPKRPCDPWIHLYCWIRQSQHIFYFSAEDQTKILRLATEAESQLPKLGHQ